MGQYPAGAGATKEPCRANVANVKLLEGLASYETKTSEGWIIFYFGK